MLTTLCSRLTGPYVLTLYWWTSDESEVHIPYYVMTSEGTHEETVAFWTTHAFFGIPQPDVFFFQQGMIPALDLEGKILLVRPSEKTRSF
jgi:UDP-N-acetylglucosamine pyrophosphorylase